MSDADPADVLGSACPVLKSFQTSLRVKNNRSFFVHLWKLDTFPQTILGRWLHHTPEIP